MLDAVQDILFMKRCLQLAQNGRGNVAPNPMVGAVIVHNNKIIGEGFHQQFGGPHAEVNAINNVIDKSLLAESTIYVNLEPCSHVGKTPACSQLLLSVQIKRVVIGIKDPFPKVNGKGIEQLQTSGIEITNGILEEECKELNKRFITFHQKKRPYIILKWAQSDDGFVGKQNETIRISNEETRLLNYKWRTEENAILVGAKTVNVDNPKLTSQNWQGNNPLRIVLSKSGNIKSDSNLFDNTTSTLVFTENNSIEFPHAKIIVLEPNNSIKQVLNHLYNLEIQSLIVEGGSTILQKFIDLNLFDEIRIFQSNEKINDGIFAPEFSLNKPIITNVGDNTLLTYQNKNAN
jgi:diaminohydroxyphosphoribosylaminopyrimidine deaminase/5-amino-6-(5-phosphoribosylamino)uracil reductase